MNKKTSMDPKQCFLFGEIIKIFLLVERQEIVSHGIVMIRSISFFLNEPLIFVADDFIHLIKCKLQNSYLN